MGNGEIDVIQRLINAARNSVKGLSYGWRKEAALRYEIYVLLVAIPVAWLLGKGPVERALMIGSALLVVVVEVINSAIEVTIDRIGKEHHELSGYAKDLASAAVFCSIALATAVWFIVLFG
jgi:diacylglycerol kinase (ATP)